MGKFQHWEGERCKFNKIILINNLQVLKPVQTDEKFSKDEIHGQMV